MTVSRHVLLQARKVGGGGGAPPIPPEAIALWTGTLAAMPANWALCDGSGGTPNLIARFIRGAPAATEPGTTGGSDTHTHASMTAAGGHSHTLATHSHQHTVSSAGDHEHGEPGPNASDEGAKTIMRAVWTYGAHQHTNDLSGHEHTTNATANHTHAISTDDGRPPYYEVAFIQAGAGALVATGIVIIWAGTLATIPAGWALCDGGDGRPDLRSRFVRGINTNITDPGATGGAANHNHTETAQGDHSHTTDNVAHSHTFSALTWTHTHNTSGHLTGAVARVLQTDAGAGNHTHANSDSIGSHNHDPMGNAGGHTHLVTGLGSSSPAYYDVAYIINTGAAVIPGGGIVIWTGLLGNIPAGYSLCDGGDGRPDMRSKFARGSNAGVDPGGTGGSDTHSHSDDVEGAHSNHSQTSAGVHTHANTDTIGAHTHTASTDTIASGIEYQNVVTAQWSKGDHFHTYGSYASHTHASLSDPGNHDHIPWSTDDGRPAYYEVAYIQKS